MAYEKSIKNNKKYAYSLRKEKCISYQQEWFTFGDATEGVVICTMCVCIYIYTHSTNTVLGGRDNKGWKKGLVSVWNSKYQGREKDINSLTTEQDSSGGKEGNMRVDNKETTARLRLKEGSLKNLGSKWNLFDDYEFTQNKVRVV